MCDAVRRRFKRLRRHPLDRGEDGLGPADDLNHLGFGKVLPDPELAPLVPGRLFHPHLRAARQPTVTEPLRIGKSEGGERPRGNPGLAVPFGNLPPTGIVASECDVSRRRGPEQPKGRSSGELLKPAASDVRAVAIRPQPEQCPLQTGVETTLVGNSDQLRMPIQQIAQQASCRCGQVRTRRPAAAPASGRIRARSKRVSTHLTAPRQSRSLATTPARLSEATGRTARQELDCAATDRADARSRRCRLCRARGELFPPLHGRMQSGARSSSIR